MQKGFAPNSCFKAIRIIANFPFSAKLIVQLDHGSEYSNGHKHKR
jgi:hypothetical protein